MKSEYVMSTNRLFTSACTLFLILAMYGFSFAQWGENKQDISQTGANNDVVLEQLPDGGNSVTIIQIIQDRYNIATVKQLSPLNVATVEQRHSEFEGPQESYIEQIGIGGNVATQIQGYAINFGYDNYAWIKQYGEENTATQMQTGLNHFAEAFQDGSFNISTQTQDGSENWAKADQSGTNHYGKLFQDGERNIAKETQWGSYHWAEVDQRCTDSFAEVYQDGFSHKAILQHIGWDHSAEVMQFGKNHYGEITQHGGSNKALQTQSGYYGHSSVITQNGTGNFAEVVQRS